MSDIQTDIARQTSRMSQIAVLAERSRCEKACLDYIAKFDHMPSCHAKTAINLTVLFILNKIANPHINFGGEAE